MGGLECKRFSVPMTSAAKRDLRLRKIERGRVDSLVMRIRKPTFQGGEPSFGQYLRTRGAYKIIEQVGETESAREAERIVPALRFDRKSTEVERLADKRFISMLLRLNLEKMAQERMQLEDTHTHRRQDSQLDSLIEKHTCSVFAEEETSDPCVDRWSQ